MAELPLKTYVSVPIVLAVIFLPAPNKTFKLPSLFRKLLVYTFKNRLKSCDVCALFWKTCYICPV